MYCWHILANKQHDMPNTKYDKFNLVVSTLFLNKWYLKKSTFLENDPYMYPPIDCVTNLFYCN